MNESSTEGRSLEEIRTLESRTDWERLRQMTEEDIEQAAKDDPDSPLLDEEWLHTARLVVPSREKTRITIRLDEDIVAYFKQQGDGYQTRINDVLKAYVLSQRHKEQRKVIEEDDSDT